MGTLDFSNLTVYISPSLHGYIEKKIFSYPDIRVMTAIKCFGRKGCWASKENLADALGMSRASVYRSIKKLIEYDFIEQGSDKQGKPVLWVVYKEPTSKEKYKNKTYNRNR